MKLKEGADPNTRYLASVDMSQTRVFALGLAGMYLNIKGREAEGIVEPEDADALREELAEKMSGLIDPENGEVAINTLYISRKIYHGPYKDEAPDLIPGYNDGYRVSWEAAVGQITESAFHDNKKAWSGDHCVDPKLVPGVMFANRVIEGDHPRLMDLGPTTLQMFGVDVPDYMDGRPLTVGEPGARAVAVPTPEPPSAAVGAAAQEQTP
ncbi:MAG: hypothetical protein IID40_01350, partial [Planctomycetes bacterium]|nr:hypothetical protein [Planctomycetota bacterium]